MPRADGGRRPVRLAHVADVHLGLASHGRDVEEFGRTFERFVDLAVEEKVDAALIAGDLFDHRNPGPRELAIASKQVRRLSKAKIETVVGTGNHDGPLTVGNADTHTLAWLDFIDLPYVHVVTKPGVFTLSSPDSLQALDVAVLPYAHKRSLNTEGLSLEQRTAEASRVLAEAIAQLAEQRREGVPFVFVGHLTTTTASLGAEAAMRMGWDVTVDPSVFDRFDYAALGHIHVGQQVGERAWYAGSPDVHAFGERAADKRFLLVEAAPFVAPVVTEIPTNPRDMVVVTARQHGEAWDLDAAISHDDIVRLDVYPTGPLDASALRNLVDSLTAAGASFVQTKIIGVPTAARPDPLTGPALDLAATLEGQIELYLDRLRTALSDEPLSPDMRRRVKEMALAIASFKQE